eukprot:scaffold22064_cov112-Isochrysis_galbana.AAC.3
MDPSPMRHHASPPPQAPTRPSPLPASACVRPWWAWWATTSMPAGCSAASGPTGSIPGGYVPCGSTQMGGWRPLAPQCRW